MHVPSQSRPLKMSSVASLITFQIPLVHFKSLLQNIPIQHMFWLKFCHLNMCLINHITLTVSH
jgi:hypothetical protein